ncbi:MAG: crossover junction endodeoxyribonuclease RuvC [Bacteroidota bacterium]
MSAAKSNTIIIGVDPGTLITGYGIIEARHGRWSMIACNAVKNSPHQSMPIRLKKIYDSLCLVIEQYHPDEFAIETAFYGKNAQSALKIGHARGVAILAAVNFQIPTTEYAPREIKKSITGNGAASKQQVQFMVKSQLQIRETSKLFDITDALAVALCHAYRHGNVSLRQTKTSSKTRSWTNYIKQHPEKIGRLS